MLLHLQLEKLWIAFGTGKHFCYIPVHYIANTLGENMSKALPFFHAMTGCDTVFSFSGKRKKTADEGRYFLKQHQYSYVFPAIPKQCQMRISQF